ncbi:MAG: hypothetical protein U9Q74_01460 [Gemmatimonadota bacterium]|nr:hypothetical protein [Gemmatimonadota bacterium]
MPFQIATLIADPRWNNSVQQAVYVRAKAAPQGPADTPARRRLNRYLLAKPENVGNRAQQMLWPVAMNPTIKAGYEQTGNLPAQGDVEFEVETELVALALDGTPDFIGIARGMESDINIWTIEGAVPVAANAILADEGRTQREVQWVHSVADSPAAIKTLATNALPMILATPQLMPYHGDLTNADPQDVLDGLAALFTNWMRQGI